ncbi:MAG TPA: tripartite tricarboxylate transporter substrate binding protein [Pseudolabrys sp.]|jgi:tripartite-type tricarboxylate transporter receptor subunit TctC|nr:tripartite tricarboxylate transporter substrate binding protein [Pseudolabrys sp.]
MQSAHKLAMFGAAVSLAVALGGQPARAEYPDHPINFIVPWGPGGGADLLARTAGKIMGEDLKVSVPVINVPGATGMTGMTKLLTSPADGYSMAILIGDTYALLAGPKPAFNADQVIPLAIMIQQPSGLWVNSTSPWKTWQDLAKTAKEKTLKVAELGFGSADDITVSYLKTKGLKFEGIPYANPGLRYTSILGGNADVLYEQTGDVRSYFDGGKIRPLIFFYKQRLNIPQFKDVPIGKEFGYDVTLPQFRAIVVKAGTDPAIVKRLADELGKVAQTAEFKTYLEQQYADPNSYVSMNDARKFMDDWLKEAQKFRTETKMGAK